MAEQSRYDTLLLAARAMTPGRRQRLLARSWPRTSPAYAEWDRALQAADGFPLLDAEETAAVVWAQAEGEVASGDE